MSSLVLAGNTSGTLTLAGPAVAGSNTLSLPAATDTLVGQATTDTLSNKTISAPTITGTTTFGSATLSSPSGSAPLAMARAWVNFNGGSGAINGSMNVSSITINSAGQYTVNMTTAAPNTNYARVASGYGGPGVFTGVDWNTTTTSSFSVYCANTVTQGYQAGNPVNAVAYW